MKKLIILALLPLIAACSLTDVPVQPGSLVDQSDALFEAWNTACTEKSNDLVQNLGADPLNCSKEAWLRTLTKESPENPIVPQAKAESEGASYAVVPASKPVVDRRASLREYLANKGSPYADIDIITHCENAGLDSHQCRLLIAICFAESNHGTNYTNTKGRPNDEGKELHNCAGVKKGSWNKAYWDSYNPGATGWWLVKFPSWDIFWSLFTAGMKQGYFDHGTQRADQLCYGYVGNPNVCEWSWVNRVQQVERDLSWMLI